jgi:hypothetical protein
VYYPLHHGGGVGDVGEVGEDTRATTAMFPPPSLLEQPLFRGFVFFRRLFEGTP